MTRCALANTFGGIVRPISLAVLRLVDPDNDADLLAVAQLGREPLQLAYVVIIETNLGRCAQRATTLEDTMLERVAVFCGQELKQLADRSAGRSVYGFFSAPDNITNQPEVGNVNLPVHCFS